VSTFRVKLGANDLNCVDVPLNPTHSLTNPIKNGHHIRHYANATAVEPLTYFIPAW